MVSKFALAVIALSCAAYSGLFAMPLWIGALADDLRISSALPGYMGSLQLLFSMLTALWVSLRTESTDTRRTAALGLGLVLFANATAVAWPEVGVLFAARALSGAGEGLLLATLNSAISRSSHPDRYFALSQTSIALFGILLFALAPPAIRSHGAKAVFAIVTLVAALGALGLLGLAPGARRSIETAAAKASRLDSAALIALAIVFVGCQGAWAYMERFGAAKELSIEQIGRWLIVGQLLSLVGPVAATRFIGRGSRRAAIAIGLIVSATATLLASQSGPWWTFAMAAAMFQFGTLFVVTSYFGYLASLDAAGRNAAAGPALVNLGSALGPAAMAFGVSVAGYPLVGWLVVASYSLAVVVLFQRRTAVSEAPA